LSSNDLVATWMMPSPVPSWDLFCGGVLVFPAASGLWSQICLRDMKVFDEEVLLTRSTGGRYGRGPPVPMPAKVSGNSPCVPLWPRCVIKCLDVFITSKYHKNDSFNWYFIVALIFWDPAKTRKKVRGIAVKYQNHYARIFI
jgi:hypothetical protein